jgi:hypothetical protein
MNTSSFQRTGRAAAVDAGKDVKVPVVEKIARTQPPAENPGK